MRRDGVKNEIPKGAIVAVIVVVALLVLGMGWKMLTSDGNPPREPAKASDVKPDPLPDPTRSKPIPSRGVWLEQSIVSC